MTGSGRLQSIATDRQPRYTYYKYPYGVDHAPEVNGVYMIFYGNDRFIYVGKSDSDSSTFRSRLLRDHINGDENTMCINGSI